MRALLASAFFFIAATTIEASNFNHYPGFLNRDSFIEMTSDKGLIVEFVLRCSREGNKVKAGIMTFSKVDRMYCSSKMRCTRDIIEAVDDTCGY